MGDRFGPVLTRELQRAGPGVQEQQRPVCARQQRIVLDSARRSQFERALYLCLRFF